MADKPQEHVEKETPELTNEFDEAEAERDPAQEVQAVRKKEATNEVVFSVTHGIHNSLLTS